MSKKMLFLSLWVLLTLVLFQAGCVTKIASKITYKPEDAKKISGLKYYVGKDLLLLNIKKTTASSKKITEALEIKGSENTEFEGKLTVQTILDMDFSFTLNNKSGCLDSSKFKIEMHENGMVKSINVESIGEGGEIIKNVFRIAGMVASFGSPTSIPLLALNQVTSNQVRNDLKRIRRGLTPINSKLTKIAKNVNCYKALTFSNYTGIPNFGSLSREVRFFLQCDQQACDLWIKLLDIEKSIEDLGKGKNGLILKIPMATPNDLKDIKARIELMNSEIERILAAKTVLGNQFQSLLTGFMEREGFGKHIENDSFVGQFNLDKIPTAKTIDDLQYIVNCLQYDIWKSTNLDKVLKTIANGPYKSYIDLEAKTVNLCEVVRQLKDDSKEVGNINFLSPADKCQSIGSLREETLGNIKKQIVGKIISWKNEFEKLKNPEIDLLIIRNFIKDLSELKKIAYMEIRKVVDSQIVDSLKEFAEVKEFYNKSGVLIFINHLTDFGKQLNRDTAKLDKIESSVIFYRHLIPVQISVYCLDSEANIGKFYEEKLDVLHPQMPIYHFAFNWSAFAKRTLGLMFNSKGQPMVFEQTGTSAAKDLTTALGESLKIARDEYADSLKKITEIQDSQRKIKMDDLSTKIEQMKKEKELIDVQLEKEVVTSNYDLTLRQRQLAAELEVLQKEFALEKAMETGPQELELAKLKLELEQLKQELEILKIKLELGKK